MKIFCRLLIALSLAGCAATPDLPPVPAYAPATLSGLTYKAVLIAGDGSEKAFDNATEAVRVRLIAAHVAPADIERLSAAPAVIAQPGVRTATSGLSLSAVERMQPGQGQGCLVFATSHGAPDRGLYLARFREFIGPADLAAALARGCGNAPTVVIVSGCYTGGFARAPMARANRVIFTAARADRPSFGCRVGLEYTFYDECLLASLAESEDWQAAYARITACVTAKEHAQHAPPSEPQAYFGEAVAGLPIPRP